MSKEPELKARDKVVLRMTREGAVEENLTAGTEQRVSKRLEDAELVKPAEPAAPSEALSAEEKKKVQMRRQQRQFQAEHAEDKDTQPPSETSVTEEKRAENPPQNVSEPLPSSETSFKPPVLEQHGVSSHTGTVIAETVVTHKLRKTSAVEAVDADAVLTQAAETASAKDVYKRQVTNTTLRSIQSTGSSPTTTSGTPLTSRNTGSTSWWSSPMTHSTSMIWARSMQIKAPSLHCAVGKA